MDLALATDDGLRGAAPQTYHAGLAFLRFNVVGGKCFTGEGGAALLPDMGLIFLREISYGAEDGVGSRLPQAAEGRVTDDPAHFLQELHIPFLSPALGDVGEDLTHPAASLPAGDTLPAGLLLGEGEEVFGHVYHAGVLVHHHQSPRTH